MVDQIGSIVTWLLIAEAGILALGVLAYLALSVIRGRDVVERVRSLEADLDGERVRIDKALKRLSPGRPPADEEERFRPATRTTSESPAQNPAAERLRQLAEVRARYLPHNGR